MTSYLPVAFHTRSAFFEVETLNHCVATKPLFDMQQRLLHLHLTLLVPCATLISAAPFILRKEREQVGLLGLGGTSPTHIPGSCTACTCDASTLSRRTSSERSTIRSYSEPIASRNAEDAAVRHPRFNDP